MGDHDNPATCLSSSEHSRNVRDNFLHYFGCLKVTERKAFYDTLAPHKQKRIDAEEERILGLRALAEQDSETKDLVAKLRSDLNDFFFPKERKKLELPAPIPLKKENGFGMSAYMVFFRDSKPYEDPNYPDKFPNQKISIEDLLYNREIDPNLHPLARECKENEIRYFHLPGNNMDWCEEAIARYYNEDRPEYEGFFRRPDNPTKTFMMLRPEFWRGQQHGGRNDVVHCRHMRPRCDIVSTDPKNLEVAPKNLVLYMPYLHWETDRRRAKFDEFMQKINEKHEKDRHKNRRDNIEKLRKEAESRMKAAKMRLDARRPHTNRSNDDSETSNFSIQTLQKWVQSLGKHSEAPNPKKSRPVVRTDFKILNSPTEVFQEVYAEQTAKYPESKFSKSKVAKHLTQGMLCPTTPLGKILYHAARLSESMDFYPEQALLKEYLHHTPPLHPRRTLDQTYYWTRKSTKKRDRDQVVYRGTTPNKEFMHSGEHCEAGCEDCRRDIRKVPRLIMVDQLWMWILDGKTIITSFPKRYGRNKPDPSAVHKSIRLRLKVCRQDEIRSAFDLAMIIIDQCSRIFFEPVKTGDRQPQVMDLFGSAIGNVAYNKTIAYEHFWATTQETSKVYKSQDPVDDAEDKAKSLLDINPEGALLREIKDIVDELDIMLSIKRKQQRVFKQFSKHVEYLIAPVLAASKQLGTLEQTRVTGDVNMTNLDAEEERIKQAEADKKERDATWTLRMALDISSNLEDRIADLNTLRGSAEHTETGLDGLLALKQQQAGVVQARKAVQQTEETLRQGRSIMLFTVVTIIFLPLSFGASVFGMNTSEYNSGPWTLKREIIYMFSVSIGIIITSFILAFSSFVRAFLSFIFHLTWTKFITITRLYSLWLNVKLDSDKLTLRKKELSRTWKEEAVKQKQRRKEEKESKLQKARVEELVEKEMEGGGKVEKEKEVMNGHGTANGRKEGKEVRIEEIV